MPFQNPNLLFLIIPALILLVAIIRKDFTKIKKIQAREKFKDKVKQRSLILLSRSLIMILLIIAMSSPFSFQTHIQTGNPTLTVLFDNSTSMDVLDTSAISELTSLLEEKIPVRYRTFSSRDFSAIGDALVIAMNGNDNILLISDGRSNHGRSFGDMLTLAASLNSTINGISLQANKDDSAVTILGPRITTNAEENEFTIFVSQVGATKEYQLTVSLDGTPVLDNPYSGSSVATFSKKFAEGYHTITAEISINDHFAQNNIFYKTIKVEPRPRILFVRTESTPIRNMFSSLYQTTTVSSLTGQNLNSYSAVVLNDIPNSEVDVNKLSKYVIDGNGLVVFGGKKSFDRGGYKDSLFEGMLPVRVGKGKEGMRKDVSIALVIDISGSTGSGFSKGSSSRIQEVEKALAIAVLNDLRPQDKVAVVAFNTDAFIVSELRKVLGGQIVVEDKIARLTYKGGTRIDEGVRAARKILAPLEGSKNMIIFSDGKSGSYVQDLYDVQIAANTGIKVFTVGVGEGTDSKHLQDIAKAGNGYYFEPDETERLKVIFGESENQDATTFPLEIVNGHHFITQGLTVSGKVNGFNQVIPKPNADLLLVTENNNPILTVSRLGLGRIVAISTDDGSAWASELLNARNSVFITRAVNWAVGDLSRNKEFDVTIKDIYFGENLDINVISNSFPSHSSLQFAKIGKRLYTTSFSPEQQGFVNFFEAVAAVNYEREYALLGMEPELSNALAITGGKLFEPAQVNEIVEKVKQDSRRIISEPISYSWMFLLAALLIFLAEIGVRRLQEGKRR